MDRLAYNPRRKKLLETTVRFSIYKETIETMDRLALIQEQKSLKQRLDFPFEEKIETMDRLAIIQEEKIVKPTVRFSI